MAESAMLDDDIVAGPSKMSLKCPVCILSLRSICADHWFS